MNHEPWVERARQALDESARDLDAATASRLNRARQAALSTSSVRQPALWGALAASALTVALAIGLWLQPATTDRPEPTAIAAEDFDMLTAEAELDLLADLDFYLWLAEELPEEGADEA